MLYKSMSSFEACMVLFVCARVWIVKRRILAQAYIYSRKHGMVIPYRRKKKRGEISGRNVCSQLIHLLQE